MPAQIGLVLEGTRAQMPIYCSAFPKVRVDGRAIPERMLLTPESAGLASTQIQWVTLKPGREPGRWERVRYAGGDGQWSFDVLELPGETAPGVSASWGTVRFAAAVRVPRAGGATATLESSGWSRTTTSIDDDKGPGLRVTRRGAPSLAGAAYSLARIPFFDAVPAPFAAQRIALQPVDLPLAAVEAFGRCKLPGERTHLPSPEWEWLFRTVHSGARRRGIAAAPLIGADGRAIALSFAAPDSAARVKPGDVIAADGRYAILEGDDGDGWLGEGDPVVHAMNGQIQAGTLSDLSGRTADVLRLRDFIGLRTLLVRAGYGVKGGASPAPTPELLKAVADFQRDHSLAVTGVPDSITVEALRGFVDRLAAADSTADSTAVPRP